MKIINVEAPLFKNDTEEADWWYDNHESMDADLLEALEKGESPDIYYALQQPKSLEIPPDDAALAEDQARRNGVPFEEHAKRLSHEAVQAEELKKAS